MIRKPWDLNCMCVCVYIYIYFLDVFVDVMTPTETLVEKSLYLKSSVQSLSPCL